MACLICEQRAAKRNCPAVRGAICSLCCGREREVSLECPFECIHLQEGHRHELQRREPPPEVVHPAHELPRGFAEEKSRLLGGLAVTLLGQALGLRGIVDEDLRKTLDALIRTYETLSTGLVYETLPEGTLRVHIYAAVQGFLARLREEESRAAGMTVTRDSDVLRALVFLARLAEHHNNQRPRGRSFIAFLHRSFPIVTEAEAPSSLIVPGA